MRRLLPLVAAIGCDALEPIELPSDPAATGVPVGVRTVTVGGLVSEVWYPASEDARGEPGETIDFQMFVSAEVDAALGDYDVETFPSIAVRDADLRRVEEPFPVVIFSHGLGGTRLQSVDFTTHLASRGYVVVATDHEGRSMPDLLPCLFSPPLDGCNLELGGDPGVPDVVALLDGLEALDEEDPLAGRLALDSVGLSGHSAGAGTTSVAGPADARFGALLPMAGGLAIEVDVPVLRMGGTCDQTVPWVEVYQEHVAGQGDLLGVQGAGHLAFSDLCALDLGAFAATYLAGRDDLNDFLVDAFVGLAIDGCPGVVPAQTGPECETAFLPIEESAPIVRHYATVFFDDALLDTGGGVQAGAYAHATLNPAAP